MFLSLSNFQCYDCDEFVDDRYEYIIDLKPSAREFNLGDTILLSLNIDSDMELKFSGDIYDNSNQYISYAFKIFELQQGQINVIPARDNFIINGIKGNISLPVSRDFDVNVYGNCSSTQCELETSLTPQKLGLYGIQLDLNYFGDINNECVTLSMSPQGFNDSGANNTDIVEELNIQFLRIEFTNFNMPKTDKRLYLFKVI
jgi:hypothetical protein